MVKIVKTKPVEGTADFHFDQVSLTLDEDERVWLRAGNAEPYMGGVHS